MSLCQDFTPSFKNKNAIIPSQNRLKDISGTHESNKEIFITDNICFSSVDKSKQTKKLNEIRSPPAILCDDSDYCIIPEKEVRNEANVADQGSSYANENQELTFIFDTKNEQTKLEVISCLRNIKGNALIDLFFLYSKGKNW